MVYSYGPCYWVGRLKFSIPLIGIRVKRKQLQMAKIIVNKAQMERALSQMSGSDLNERAEKVLQKAKELAPRDTGDLANSLRVTRTIEGSKAVYRIVSDDPNIKEILYGTKGPYGSIPPWRSSTSLGGWAGRHGFTTNKSKYMLSKRIATHGTRPAGTSEGKQDWVREALREATK